MKDQEQDSVQLDTGPVDVWVGVPLGGGQMKDPVAPNDIRRWAQGMQNFDDALLQLYKDGTITLEEAMSHADSRSNLEAKVNFGG